MKILKIQYFSIILFLILIAISTLSSANTTLQLQENIESYANFNIEYLKEKSDKTLTIDDVSMLKFNAIQKSAFSFGYCDKPIWFKFSIINDSTNPKEMILEISEMFHKTVDLYILSEPVFYEKNGMSVPIDERKIKELNPSFTLLFDAKERKDVFIKIESTYSIFGEIKIKSPMQYENDTKFTNNLFIFYLGAILIIALYNLFIYFYLKEKVYLYYVGYVLSFTLWAVLYRGFILRYIDMNTYDFLQIILPIFFIMFTLFSQSLLETKKYLPSMHKILNIFISILIVNVIWVMISLYSGFNFMNFVVTLLIPILVFTAITLYRKGHKTALIYIIALLIYFMGISMINLVVLGVMPYTSFTSNFVLLGSFIEIILFSLLLAYKISTLKKEKITSQENLLIQKDTESIRLSQMVEEKTIELSVLNNQLADELLKKEELEKILMMQASTDSLTGILNRRAFFDECIKVVETSKRYKNDLSFLIIDIDFFKEINDTYGHLNGDIVLMDLVKIIENTIRSTDIFGRIGGEEFAVLMPETKQSDAINLAERIRHNISKHESVLDSHTVNVTVSIGLSYLTKEDSIIQTVLRRADLALFKAKENGRNQTLMYNDL